MTSTEVTGTTQGGAAQPVSSGIVSTVSSLFIFILQRRGAWTKSAIPARQGDDHESRRAGKRLAPVAGAGRSSCRHGRATQKQRAHGGVHLGPDSWHRVSPAQAAVTVDEDGERQPGLAVAECPHQFDAALGMPPISRR
jgi:hypothetical protein